MQSNSMWVALWHNGMAWTCDQEGMGSIHGLVLLRNDSGQVVHTHVPLSPSSITWYWCKSCGGNGRL